jgi:hypothetical protein
VGCSNERSTRHPHALPAAVVLLFEFRAATAVRTLLTLDLAADPA